MSTQRRSFAVVGGGIAGLAIALKLTRQFPGARVTLYEKEAEVALHQSGHNSGVLHAGLYYKPGSLKARLAVSGIRQMKAFCRENGVPHEVCGKLVVACSEDELPRLKELLNRGQKNGLTRLRWLGPEQMREIEPHVAGVAAVQVPEEGIVDYAAVCQAMKKLIQLAGGEVRTGAPVERLQQSGGEWTVITPAAEDHADFLFNCAGLQSDLLLSMAGERRTTRIVPFRGEYFMLNESGRRLVRNLIYPVPDPKFPFLGVHFTRMIHGGVEAGPNAVLAMAREGYRKTGFNARELADSLTYPGFWRFLARYPSMAFYELWRSVNKREFCRSLQRLVPEVELSHLSPGGSGIRAQAVSPDGTPVQDFDYVVRENALHLINAPSPGATASLAIADHLLEQIGAPAAMLQSGT